MLTALLFNWTEQINLFGLYYRNLTNQVTPIYRGGLVALQRAVDFCTACCTA